MYTEFAENAKTFVLFQKGSQLFIPIPKRDLNPLQIEELRMLMKQGIGRDINRHVSR
ncbi:MAG: YcxB family protein [Janthinobacterium lividum]